MCHLSIEVGFQVSAPQGGLPHILKIQPPSIFTMSGHYRADYSSIQQLENTFYSKAVREHLLQQGSKRTPSTAMSGHYRADYSAVREHFLQQISKRTPSTSRQ